MGLFEGACIPFAVVEVQIRQVLEIESKSMIHVNYSLIYSDDLKPDASELESLIHSRLEIVVRATTDLERNKPAFEISRFTVN